MDRLKEKIERQGVEGEGEDGRHERELFSAAGFLRRGNPKCHYTQEDGRRQGHRQSWGGLIKRPGVGEAAFTPIVYIYT